MVDLESACRSNIVEMVLERLQRPRQGCRVLQGSMSGSKVDGAETKQWTMMEGTKSSPRIWN